MKNKKKKTKKPSVKIVSKKPPTGKKRGRPPKVKTEEKPLPPKKRGKYKTSNETADKKAVDKDSKVLPVPLTREQMEDRREAISATLPKINFHRIRNIIDLTKDAEKCAEYTSFVCQRPDIYLDYGCAECSLHKHCACPIKDINRKPDGRAPKIRKFVTKPKISA